MRAAVTSGIFALLPVLAMILNNGTLKKTMAWLPEQIDQFGGQRVGERSETPADLLGVVLSGPSIDNIHYHKTLW